MKNEDGTKRYDFQYVDKYGYKVTMGGLSHQFNSEFWNYAKLISGVLTARNACGGCHQPDQFPEAG